jgi:dihydroorotate dehydrogenase
MFRAVAEEALINRMGFNNGGAPAMAEQLAHWKQRGLWPKHPIGINLGKSKITPNDEAVQDYANSFRNLWPLADFFVVNVSSPNTPNLRQLQDKSALDAILLELQSINSSLSASASSSSTGEKAGPKPILVKVAPDLTFEALDEILELAGPRNLAGIVATNTTLARPATADAVAERVYRETGGLSGRPLTVRSTEVVRHLYRTGRGRVPIIGVGGIFNAQDAWDKITAGACLVQIYSGMVYEGPGIVRDVVQGLTDRMREAGLKSIQEAVGLHSK